MTDLDERLMQELAPWMKVNGEAIHGTRPWKLFGEGPTSTNAGAFQESADYTARDIRFTTKGNTLYAITLGEPSGSVAIASLARGNAHEKRAVRSVHLLGRRQPLTFRQTDSALVVDLPPALPSRHASALRIAFA